MVKEEYDINGFLNKALNKALKAYNNDLGWEFEEEFKQGFEERFKEGFKKGELSALAIMYKLTNNLNLVYEAAAIHNISEEVVNNYLKDQGPL
ncbi:hypothetical protein AN644_03015 [Candidatus Epulonipiscium fishelsonii]|nr:hypothetical protein AN644_03015 [Epulopiscium sp. SCG-C06WGA-EpuloA1]